MLRITKRLSNTPRTFLMSEWFMKPISLSTFLEKVTEEYYGMVPDWQREYGSYIMIADDVTNTDFWKEEYIVGIERIDKRCLDTFYVRRELEIGEEEYVSAIPFRTGVLGLPTTISEEVCCGEHPIMAYDPSVGWEKTEWGGKVYLEFYARGTIHSHPEKLRLAEFLSVPDLLHALDMADVATTLYCIVVVTKKKKCMYFECDVGRARRQFGYKQIEQLEKYYHYARGLLEKGKLTPSHMWRIYREILDKLERWNVEAQIIAYTI